MGHPKVDNRTPYAFEALYVADEEGRPVVAVIVKATYGIARDGKLALASEQQPVLLAGVCNGDPDVSSWRFEPEFAFVKPATDVVLVGHAQARHAQTTELLVSLQVAQLKKTLLVSGDREWQSRWLGAKPSEPVPFEKIPLLWERAFGGWDRSAEDPAKHRCEPFNPVGIGFRLRGAELKEGAPLPNIEDPDDRQTSFTGRAKPIGVGFIGPNWKPRSDFAGTYDAAWDKQRKPLLPRDFDRRFFNAAAPGLIAAGHLRGDESVVVTNVTPSGSLKFALPAPPPPRCKLEFVHKPDETLDGVLDTVVIDADLERVILTWRAHTLLRDGPHDVRSYLVAGSQDPLWTRTSARAPGARK